MPTIMRTFPTLKNEESINNVRSSAKSRIMKLLIAIFLMSLISVVHAASSEDYLKEAEVYAKKGDIDAAIIQLKNALQKDPKNIKARFFLGKNYLKRGNGANAEKEFSRAQRLGMARKQMVVPLGRSMLLQGHADDVLKKIKIEKGFSVDVQADVYVLQANAHTMLKQYKSAGGLFEKAIKLTPKSLIALTGQARLMVVTRDFKEAKRLAEKIIKIHPESDSSWVTHGEISRLTGDMKSSEKSFDKAISLQSSNLAALLGSANAKLVLGDKAGATERINAVQRINPNNPFANHMRAILLFGEGDISGAEASLKEVFRVLPNHLPSLQMMGAIDFRKGRYEQADQALTQVVQAYPTNVSAVKLLAAIRMKLNQPAEAIKLLEKVLRNASDDPQLMALVGSAYMQNKQVVKGVEFLERAVELAPKTAGIRTQLAMSRLATGQKSQAIKELEAAVDLGQNVFQADMVLIMVHLRDKEYKKALKQAEQFSRKKPDEGLPHNLMGAAYVGMGKSGKAREQFTLALKKQPKFLPAIMNLGRMEEKDGKKESARSYYEKTLKHNNKHIDALLSLSRLSELSGDKKRALKYLEIAWESNDGALKAGMALLGYYNRHNQPLRAISIARDLKVKNPENLTVLRILGTSQMVAKEYEAALVTFGIWIKKSPNSLQAHLAMANANQQLGHIDKARGNIKKSLSIDGNFIVAKVALARLELIAKKPKAALVIAKNIQKQYPQKEIGFHLEADVLMQQKKYKKAVNLYKSAFKKKNSSSLVLAIYTAQSKSKHSNPHSVLEKWLKDHSDDNRVRMVLASAYQLKEMWVKAVEQYKKIIKITPKNVAALNNLAWASYKLGDANAVDYANRAYDLASDSPAVIDTLGWLLVETGKINRGLVLLQQAVIKAPHIAEIRYHLGVGYHKAGRKAEAKSELKRVLSMSPDFTDAKAARALLKELGK